MQAKLQSYEVRIPMEAAAKEAELESLRKQCTEHHRALDQLTAEKNCAVAEKDKAEAELIRLRQERQTEGEAEQLTAEKGRAVPEKEMACIGNADQRLPRSERGSAEGRGAKRKAPVPSEPQPPAKHGSAYSVGRDDLLEGPWQQLPAFRSGRDFLEKLR
jgi:hypothetical protein